MDYWIEMLKKDFKRPPHTVAIIDGHHYVIGPENADGMRGFGGDKFIIHFKDGKEVITTNLWYQGEIPEEYKQLFYDNADFDYKWVKIGNCNHIVPKNKKV